MARWHAERRFGATEKDAQSAPRRCGTGRPVPAEWHRPHQVTQREH
ncbi:MAG: hypothetical protein QOD43_204, partial [Gaiellaceae bacterium]|nr:hypothetical protein [Gaiellaceae bacterium]